MVDNESLKCYVKSNIYNIDNSNTIFSRLLLDSIRLVPLTTLVYYKSSPIPYIISNRRLVEFECRFNCSYSIEERLEIFKYLNAGLLSKSRIDDWKERWLNIKIK